MVLAHAWPFGSWEDCAYSVLNFAGQLNQQKIALEQKVAELSKPQAPPKK